MKQTLPSKKQIGAHLVIDIVHLRVSSPWDFDLPENEVSRLSCAEAGCRHGKHCRQRHDVEHEYVEAACPAI